MATFAEQTESDNATAAALAKHLEAVKAGAAQVQRGAEQQPRPGPACAGRGGG
jgi:hypothetical protein